ncbi:four-carbon acid sugar kinase family protein [uncultured Hoeflea sp.]|uniref:four-carbon acid sugar kinase family protein n=1 Tax=uncultured Hoeflea sp. TaxID=538666 RepID=UPI0030D79F7D
MSVRPFAVFIGDDFTGASDTLASWARSGARVKLFLDAGEAVRGAKDIDIVGIATELRGLPANSIRARVSEIAHSIGGLKPRFVHYKVCSTFDSGPETGSIGAAVSEFERVLDPVLTLVLGGQPSLARYCTFGNLFARAADGQVYRIDRHPVMRRHPVTPMTEADLAVHLAAQGVDGLQLFSLTQLAAGAESLAQTLRAGMAEGACRFLLDAASASDISVIGEALGTISDSRPVLLVGASSVAEALASGTKGRIVPAPVFPSPRRGGACLVVAGSRSSVTEQQVSAAATFDKIALAPDTLRDAANFKNAVDRISNGLKEGRNIVAYTLPGADYMIDAGALTRYLVELVAAVLHKVEIGGLGIAGGDTSSAICQKLGFSALEFGSDINAGVSLCIGHHADPALDGMLLMLKGGQMGMPDLFDRFAASFISPT